MQNILYTDFDMSDDNSKTRRRMVVEEVSPVSNTPISDSEPLEEIKEKVEELQDITEHMSEDVKESAEVQEEIVEAAEKAEPTMPLPVVEPSFEPSFRKRSTGPNPLVIIIPGVLLLGALLGGIVFYQKGVNNNQEEATPTPTDMSATTPTSTTATPSPTTKVDLTKYTVNIFNGSGIPGEAGKVKDLITAAGFKAGTTTNAATYDYTKTIIKAKAAVDPAFITKLSETLGKTYVVDNAQTLDTTAKDDVEVIVGTSKVN